MLRTAICIAGLAIVFATTAHAELVRRQSPHPVDATIDRLESVIEQRGLTVFARIDHAAAAKKAGLELRPTELIIFGSPAVGTPLMQAQQTMGLSLPLKILAWQDSAGQVWLGYDAPRDVAAEREVPADHPLLGKIADALNGMTEAATAK